MRSLPRTAQLYILACYLLGALAGGWLIVDDPIPEWSTEWVLAGLLAVLAAAAQLFVVDRGVGRKTHYSDHLTPAPIFAAMLLLPGPLVALVVLATFVPEWIRFRRAWFIQLFNIASYLIAVSLARLTLADMTSFTHLQEDVPLPAVAIMLLIPVFLGVQTTLLAVVLRLARDRPFRETGLFTLGKALFEGALCCLGWAFAAAWLLEPLYSIAAVVPLAVISQALHVPNLREEAATDPKTGLANMRHFSAALPRELERAERNGQAASILMCDLDYLRNINNSYGHQVGDVVLQGVADVIQHTIRGCDLAARFGGEEFIILLTDTNRDEARRVAERLRTEFERRRFEIGEGFPPIEATVSVGVASYPGDGRNGEAVVREADLALYQAKRDGRNRVVVASRTSRELVGDWAREQLFIDSNGPDSLDNLPARRFPMQEPVQVTVRKVEAPPFEEPAPSRQESRDGIGDVSKPEETHLKLFVALVLFTGLAAVAPGLVVSPPHLSSWYGLMLFAALIILGEHLAVDIDGRGKTSVSVVAILGASFLYGEVGVLVAALVFAVWAKIKAQSPMIRLLFNFGMALTGASFANWGLSLLTGGSLTLKFHWMLLPAALAGLTYFVINHLLLSIVRGMAENRPTFEIFRSNYRWLWPHYAVFGVLGLVTALAYRHFGWAGLLALAAPVAMMHVAIKQYMDRTNLYVDELRRLNGRLTDSYEATLQALTRALDMRDEETEEHSQRVRRYAEMIAHRVGMSDDAIEHLSRGALLHDIGKIGVPDAILLKSGRLSEVEAELMRRHPTIGFTMIAHIPFLAKAAEVVLHHHERYDGNGYPSGLYGENIPLAARIFAVVDAFDAITSDRPYRKALTPEEARAEIERCSGTQFDPRIVEAFLSIPIEEVISYGRGGQPFDAKPGALIQRPAEFVATGA